MDVWFNNAILYGWKFVLALKSLVHFISWRTSKQTNACATRSDYYVFELLVMADNVRWCIFEVQCEWCFDMLIFATILGSIIEKWIAWLHNNIIYVVDLTNLQLDSGLLSLHDVLWMLERNTEWPCRQWHNYASHGKRYQTVFHEKCFPRRDCLFVFWCVWSLCCYMFTFFVRAVFFFFQTWMGKRI